ncbi:MAG: DUF1743 domain-containing protein [Thermoplasmatota archaeon]
MSLYHIGVDSTDSAEMGMCTTYLGARILEALDDLELNLVSPPELIRLNPNVPWKTRGNGAVCLRYEGEEGLEKEIFTICEELTEELSVLQDPQTNPGLVLLIGDVPSELNDLYNRALHRIIDVDHAKRIMEGRNCIYRGWKNERGLIGAASAVGSDLERHTYEVILYRDPSLKSRERSVDLESVRRVSREHVSTFFNVDSDGNVLCIPHSPCPIILGLRGVDPGDLIKASSSLIVEGLERWVLWKTNQHTDAHIEETAGLSDPTDHSSISAKGRVSSDPVYGPGGHLYFEITDDHGGKIQCAAYEPTKGFRKELSHLIKGDQIRVWGGIRPAVRDHPRTLNLEKVQVISLLEITDMANPFCRKCGGRMESMGSGQGLRCKKCGFRDDAGRKIPVTKSREISVGFIEPPPGAWRHLYRPLMLPVGESSNAPPVHFGINFQSG